MDHPRHDKHYVRFLHLFAFLAPTHKNFQQKISWIHQPEVFYYNFQKEDTDDGFLAVLVGNKCDLKDNRQVSFEEGKELAEEQSIDFIECSAKNNLNVNDVFKTVIKRYYNKNENHNQSF